MIRSLLVGSVAFGALFFGCEASGGGDADAGGEVDAGGETCLAKAACAQGETKVGSCDGASADCHAVTACGETVYCDPAVACTAAPACDPKDTQVAAQSDCPSDTNCYERQACGQSIWCFGPQPECAAIPLCPIGEAELDSCPADATTCHAVTECGTTIYCQLEPCEAGPPACDAGDTEVATEADCATDTSCYSRTSCGHTIWCAGDPAACDGFPSCQAGDSVVANEAACPQDATCYSETLCGETIWCTDANVSCSAVPLCDPGHQEVGSSTGCLMDDAVCYQVTACDQTIWCTGPGSCAGCADGDPALGAGEGCPDSATCYAVQSCGEALQCVSVATQGTASILGAGYSFGECMGPCVGDLGVAGATVQLAVVGWDGANYSDNSGQLTDTGLAQAASTAEALIGVSLKAVYGCPDCADGGEAHVTIQREGAVSTHRYDFGQPPVALTDIDAFVVGVIEALKSCTATADVTPAADCVPPAL